MSKVKYPFSKLTDNAKRVWKEIEKSLDGLSVREALNTLNAATTAMLNNNKVVSNLDSDLV